MILGNGENQGKDSWFFLYIKIHDLGTVFISIRTMCCYVAFQF